MAKLASTVYVQDPDTHQTVTLDEGTSPEPRLAALVTNPAAWVDRKPPRLPKAATQAKPDSQQQDGDPTGGGPDDASGATSEPSADGDQAAPAAKKTAARKTAASKPARGRDAAAEGTSGD